MSDDLDDLLRSAMTTLDRQVPSDYFEALPARTLARLDDPALAADEPADELARERAARAGTPPARTLAPAPDGAREPAAAAASASDLRPRRRRRIVVGAI